MKKIRFALIGLILAGIILNSCSDKVLQPTQPTQVENANQRPFKKWMQDTYPAVSKSDPITFYNEFEIKIEAKIPKKITMFKDGVTYYIDSSTVVSLKIPKLTPGVLEVETSNSPRIMTISFDESNSDYNIMFVVQTDKSFAQDERCKITFEGIKYDAKAVTVSSKDVLNHLLSDFEWLNLSNKIESQAGGRNATGTKIIKEK